MAGHFEAITKKRVQDELDKKYPGRRIIIDEAYGEDYKRGYRYRVTEGGSSYLGRTPKEAAAPWLDFPK